MDEYNLTKLGITVSYFLLDEVNMMLFLYFKRRNEIF